MNWYSVFAAGIIGALAAFMGSIVSKKLIRESDKKETATIIVSMIFFAVFSLLGQLTISPIVENLQAKSDINNTLDDMAKELPTFSFIKKHDPARYEDIVKEMAKIGSENKSKSAAEINQVYYNYASGIINNYLLSAPDNLLVENAIAVIDTISNINTTNPDLACRYLFPNHFGGVKDTGIITGILKKNNIFSIQEKIIIAGAGKFKKPDLKKIEAEGTVLLEKHRNNFAARFPQDSAMFSKIADVKTTSEKKKLVNAFIKFQKLIHSYKKEDVIKILRYTMS